jgi:hypothetical protein
MRDLMLFENWEDCRRVRVEHGADGARLLTLMELARRFRSEQLHIQFLRKTGQRTTYMESAYILDLALDKRTAPVPVKFVPWNRFQDVLREIGLEEETWDPMPRSGGLWPPRAVGTSANRRRLDAGATSGAASND